MSQQKTKIQIIEETVEFYTHNPRSVFNALEKFGKCLYKGPNGEQCAFQRCVETDLSPFDNDLIPSCIAIMGKINVEFKDEYQEHDSSFWQDIQLLHDTKDNWINRFGPGGGLTEDGKCELDRLKQKYS